MWWGGKGWNECSMSEWRFISFRFIYLCVYLLISYLVTEEGKEPVIHVGYKIDISWEPLGQSKYRDN